MGVTALEKSDIANAVMDSKSLTLIGGAPTNVFSLHGGGERSIGETPLVLVVPGNPGISHLYIPFARKIFKLGKNMLDVSVVSNAGQSPGCYKVSVGSSSTASDWFCLQDQVGHKLSYLEQEAAERKSLILIGHSIGCLVVLKMMEKLDPARVKKVILLFPVIERVALSPKAQSRMSCLWSFLQGPFLFIAWVIFRLTPSFIWSYFWKYYFSDSPLEHFDSLAEGMMLLNEKCLYNLLQYARFEMNNIREPPLDLINKNIHKTVFYYGAKDSWNVENCYQNMAARYPGKVHLLPSHVKHAFVEHASDEVANIVHSNIL